MSKYKKITFSEYFKLNKSQLELDFVDIPVNNGDIPLFIDPFFITQLKDQWSIECHNLIVRFFQKVVNHIKDGETREALYMLGNLVEPNQTRLGLSKGRKPQGKGVSGDKSKWIYRALADSKAVVTGFLQSLEDCELLIDGISSDSISDICTNIIREKLIEYTQSQCSLHQIPVSSVNSGRIYNIKEGKWENRYVQLPVCNGRSVLLVPKIIVKFESSFNYREYYQHFVLNFLQELELKQGSSLVRTLKTGEKKPPTKKDLTEKYPLTKGYLYTFSKEHPEVLERYKKTKTQTAKAITNEEISKSHELETDFSERIDELIQYFDEINPGNNDATKFHDHILSCLETIFYPQLTNPTKEEEINEGRKRIDITFSNTANEGFFLILKRNKDVPCSYIMIECKNYSNEVENPELDQLSGRFSELRGKFGILICRQFKDKNLFYKRCRDTALAKKELIIALDDEDIKHLLELRKKGQYAEINLYLEKCYKKLVM